MRIARRLLPALAVLVGAACSGGGECTYDPAVTGTVAITSIEAPSGASGSCSTARYANYAWSTGGPSRFLNMDRLLVSDSCVSNGTLKVGTTFQVTREDIKTGTCTPSIRTVLDSTIKTCQCQ